MTAVVRNEASLSITCAPVLIRRALADILSFVLARRRPEPSLARIPIEERLAIPPPDVTS